MPLARPTGLQILPYNLPADMAAWVAYMITYGWMEAAPAVPTTAAAGGQVLQDDAGQVFQDDDGQVLQND